MSRSQTAPQKPCTRYGTISSPVAKMGNEERFTWQKATSSSDGVYDLPDVKSTRIVTFGSALRNGDQSNPDAIKRTTGPGSYEFGHCYDNISDYRHRHANRFGGAPRESLELKTPSPGAVYDITKQYWNGPDKGTKIGFNCDSRYRWCSLVYIILFDSRTSTNGV